MYDKSILNVSTYIEEFLCKVRLDIRRYLLMLNAWSRVS